MHTSPQQLPLSKEPQLIIGTLADSASTSRLRQLIRRLTQMFQLGRRGFADPLEEQQFKAGQQDRQSARYDLPSF